jgi:sporulation protein YlmC with PRC-barrel domain
MQVVDIRGVVVGNVKDVSVDFQNRALAFRVTTRNNTELDIGWDDILSAEDIVLVKKNVHLATSAPPTIPSTPLPPTGQGKVTCPSCGASSLARAKFCPKCGASFIKQKT